MNSAHCSFRHSGARGDQIHRLSSTLAALIVLLSVVQVRAQFRWLSVGSFQTPYSAYGAVIEAQPFDNAAVQWPAIDNWAGNNRAQVLWVAAKNFEDAEGETWPIKVAHIGPRGVQIQFYPKILKVIGRSDLDPPPVVTVDGAQSFLRYVFVDEFEDMGPDRMVHNVSTTSLGVDVEQKAYAFSQEFHDNYHIIEYAFTNTGVVDPEQTVTVEQTLEGVYFFFISRHAIHAGSSWVRGNGAPWGKFTMNDAVGDGHEDYDVDFRAQFAWAGFNPDQTDFNTIGGSMWNSTTGHGALAWGGWGVPDDTLGRLAAAHMVGRVTIHADKSVDDRSDDPDQPSTMGVMGSDDPDLVEFDDDIDLMKRQYDWMSGVKSKSFSQTDPLGGESNGRLWPHQANQVEPDDDGGYTLGENFATPTNNPALFPAQGRFDEGGWAFIEGYGPYTLEPGDHINIVVAEAAAGLSDSAKLGIGKAYKATGSPPDEEALIEWPEGSGVKMTKNEWVLTSRDSLFQAFERAIANYESGYNIPQPPLPPKTFAVSSGADAITLEWEMYGTGPTVTAFEIWRVKKRYHDATGYVRIPTLDADARSYRDEDVVRGIHYYYYIQAVGEVNNDPTGLTPTGVALKSGRYYTQTYLPATLKRLPGETLKEVRIVPNPFQIGSDQDVRWPDKQDKLGFLEIPGECTISIYSQLGELIETIEHTDGSGDEFWDHTTSSRQVIASGLYIAVIKDHETGKTVIKKFVVIR